MVIRCGIGILRFGNCDNSKFQIPNSKLEAWNLESEIWNFFKRGPLSINAYFKNFQRANN
jgi:hypothetical protein